VACSTIETRYLVGGADTQIVTFGDGDVEPAFGLDGGGDGTLNFIELEYPDGKRYRATTKDHVRAVPAGTLYVQQAGGGGGHGPPRERSAELVAREVRDGIVSAGAARERYGVAVDPKTGQLDAAETARLRGKS
jgi:N-methylhydantoinase B